MGYLAPDRPQARRGGYLSGRTSTAPASRSTLEKIQAGAESVGKGLLRSVGYVRSYDPEEYAGLGKAAEIIGTGAQFIPLLRGVGLATRGAMAAARVPALLRFPLLSSTAAGAQELGKQVVGAATGTSEFDPKSPATAALYGAAVPLALGAPGQVIRRGLEAVGAGNLPRVGALAAKFIPGRARQLQNTAASRLTTLERRAGMTQVPKSWAVQQTLNTWEKHGGPTTARGAIQLGRTMYSVAQGLVGPGGKPTDSSRALAEAARYLLSEPRVTVQNIGGQIVRRINFVPRTGDLTPAAINGTYGRLGRAIESSYFKQHVNEAEWLRAVADTMLLQTKTPTRVAADFFRGFLTHHFIGVGNVGSALVNLTSLYTNVVTKFGLANTMWAMQQYFSSTPLAKMAARQVIGKGFGQISTPGGGGVVKVDASLLSQASLSLFSWGERLMRPVAAMAHFKGMVDKGASQLAAARGMQQAARTTLFDYQWNTARLLRNPSFLGDAMRVLFQFYNFPLQQQNFMAGLTVPQFAQFVTNLVTVGGAVAIPFAQEADKTITNRIPAPVVERLPYLMVGVSILDRLTADPQLQKYVEGPLAQATNVSLGQRVTFTDDFITRLMSLDSGPFQQWAKNFGEALDRWTADPSPSNLQRLATLTVAPLSYQRAAQAVETEKTGRYTTRTGLPLPGEPTEGDIGRLALGLTPLNLSRARATQRIAQAAEEQRNLVTADPRMQLRRAVLSGDPGKVAEARQRMVELGYKRRDLRRIQKEVRRSPERRLVRELPRPIRAKYRDILEPAPTPTRRKGYLSP